MLNLTFYREWDGRWYVDLPDFPGEQAELEMVLGADSMLDIYAQGENRINLTIFLDEQEALINKGVDRFDTFIKDKEDIESGAIYVTKKVNGIAYKEDFLIWLCDVTKWVFGNFPDKLFISIY